MSQWKASGRVGKPPYKEYRSRGSSIGSVSTLSSVSSSQVQAELRPSKFYNKDHAVTERRENMVKILDLNEQISKKTEDKETKKGGFADMANIFAKSCTQQVRSNSKDEAIRDWETRQQKKMQEKGLFATMDQRGYHHGSFNQYGGWAKEAKPREIIRTIYLPAGTLNRMEGQAGHQLICHHTKKRRVGFTRYVPHRTQRTNYRN